MWTLFLVFLSAAGEPIQFEPLTSYPEKMMCNWDASRLSRDQAEILTPNTERDFVELPVQYACIMTQQKQTWSAYFGVDWRISLKQLMIVMKELMLLLGFKYKCHHQCYFIPIHKYFKPYCHNRQLLP